LSCLRVEFWGQVYISILPYEFTVVFRVEFISGVYEVSFRVACYRLNLLVIFTDEVYISSLQVVIVGHTLRSQFFSRFYRLGFWFEFIVKFTSRLNGSCLRFKFTGCVYVSGLEVVIMNRVLHVKLVGRDSGSSEWANFSS